jgi:hypothetical protein
LISLGFLALDSNGGYGILYPTKEKPMNTLRVGTFGICGNVRKGYFIVDHDKFNNWGVKRGEGGENFKTRAEACEYAKRCHEFKTGLRMTV